MARAKRTDRAEARRRSRAAFADPLAQGDPAVDGAADPEDASTPSRAQAAGSARSRSTVPAPPRGAAPAPQRASVTAAFRSSFRPVDLRADLRALPRLLLSRAFLATTVVSGACFILAVLVPNEGTATLYTYFTAPPVPIGAVFVAGFFAPRASWLVGALVSWAAMLLQLPLLVASQPTGVVLNLFVTAGTAGALFAAGAAWYRRFLQRANPNRPRPAATTSRRPDGKIPKKPQQRPMLARRR